MGVCICSHTSPTRIVRPCWARCGWPGHSSACRWQYLYAPSVHGQHRSVQHEATMEALAIEHGGPPARSIARHVCALVLISEVAAAVRQSVSLDHAFRVESCVRGVFVVAMCGVSATLPTNLISPRPGLRLVLPFSGSVAPSAAVDRAVSGLIESELLGIPSEELCLCDFGTCGVRSSVKSSNAVVLFGLHGSCAMLLRPQRARSCIFGDRICRCSAGYLSGTWLLPDFVALPPASCSNAFRGRLCCIRYCIWSCPAQLHHRLGGIARHVIVLYGCSAVESSSNICRHHHVIVDQGDVEHGPAPPAISG